MSMLLVKINMLWYNIIFMRYIVRNSLTGFLLTFMLAYFIRLWALDHGHKLLGTLATVYMFIMLLPVLIVIIVLVIILLFFVFAFLTNKRKNFKPFWVKNKTWTR